MTKHYIFIFLAIFFATATSTNCSTELPSSTRSRTAISTVQQELTRDFLKTGLQYGSPIYIRIFKQEKVLEIWVKKKNQFHLFKTYQICTYGSGSLGPKVKQGDGQAPEGFYYVKPNQLNPVSRFHLSFNLGYPNKYDRIHKRTGSALMVHGNCVSIGCYAMTDEKINEIYAIADAALRNGQSFYRVHIFPFKMTNENMKKNRTSQWYSFWQNLKEGYDFFEKQGHIPPNTKVENGRYTFEDAMNN